MGSVLVVSKALEQEYLMCNVQELDGSRKLLQHFHAATVRNCGQLPCSERQHGETETEAKSQQSHVGIFVVPSDVRAHLSRD